jgi:hypothetical protein
LNDPLYLAFFTFGRSLQIRITVTFIFQFIVFQIALYPNLIGPAQYRFVADMERHGTHLKSWDASTLGVVQVSLSF